MEKGKEGKETAKPIPIVRQGSLWNVDKDSILPLKKNINFILLVYDGYALFRFDDNELTKKFAESQDDYGTNTLYDEEKKSIISLYQNQKKEQIFKDIYFKFKEIGVDIKIRG